MTFTFGNSSRAVLALLLTSLALGGFNRAQSAPAPLKISQPLKDLTGISRPIPNKGSKATVLVFVAKDCPISNMYAPEISRIANDYSKRGVQLMVVYAESELTSAKARAHAKEYGFKMPLLIDSKHTLSSSLGATVTPEAVVVGPDGRRLYMGRIDNRHAGFGKTRKQTTQRDLRVALDAVLAGKAVPTPVTTAVGCFIPEPVK